MIHGYIEYNKGSLILALKAARQRPGDVNVLRLLKNTIDAGGKITTEYRNLGSDVEVRVHTSKNPNKEAAHA